MARLFRANLPATMIWAAGAGVVPIPALSEARRQDVMVRVNTHPASKIAELLPWTWTATV